MDEYCDTCGHELHDDNNQRECECGELLCRECISEHNAGCSEYVAKENDKWGAATPVGIGI